MLKFKLPKEKYGKWVDDPRTVKPSVDYTEEHLTLYNYKEPLEKVKDGYGYLGTLVSTNDGMYVQCHVCGKLFSRLCPHIKWAHKLTAAEYKNQFGLMKTTALVSEHERARLKETFQKYLDGLTEEEKRDFYERRKEWSLRGRGKRGKSQPNETLESKNKKGTCPDQLLTKIMECREALGGKTPSKNEFINFTGTQRYIHLVYKNFGSWKNAIEALGMETRSPTIHDKGGKKYSDEQLLAYLRHYAEKEQVRPTATDFRRGLLPDYKTYISHFGSIENARVQAGVYEVIKA